jgi:hypothetical protein
MLAIRELNLFHSANLGPNNVLLHETIASVSVSAFALVSLIDVVLAQCHGNLSLHV